MTATVAIYCIHPYEWLLNVYISWCLVGLPIPIVAVSVGLSYDIYGIEDANEKTIS